jgi:hypothetical protein
MFLKGLSFTSGICSSRQIRLKRIFIYGFYVKVAKYFYLLTQNTRIDPQGFLQYDLYSYIFHPPDFPLPSFKIAP